MFRTTTSVVLLQLWISWDPGGLTNPNSTL